MPFQPFSDDAVDQFLKKINKKHVVSEGLSVKKQTD